MPDIAITIPDLDKALRALSYDAGQLGAEMANAVADEVVIPRLREYPPASGRGQAFRSAKARRFFFAALRSGAITVPYRRTGDLGRRVGKDPFRGGIHVNLLSNHAEIVRGDGQAKYHKGTWPTVAQVAKESEGEAGPVAERYAQGFLRKAGL